MMNFNEIVDDIGGVVAKLRSVTDGPPYYMYGSTTEVNERLIKKTKAAKQKYPLIFLMWDFPEPVTVGGMYHYDLHMGILQFTDQNLTTEQRRVQVFNPVLNPLYEKFIHGLLHAKLAWPGYPSLPPHTPIARPYWGTLQSEKKIKNVFTDPLDCIEILNLKVNKRIKYC